jgi:hypothetical protein
LGEHLIVLESKARTTSTTSPIFANWQDYEAAHIIVDITDGTNLVVDVKAKDTASNKSYTLLTSAVLVSGTTVLRIGPAYTAGANIAKDYMPSQWFVETTVSGASTTFSVGATLV